MLKLNRLSSFILLFSSLMLILPSFAGCAGPSSRNTFTELLTLVPASEASDDSPVYFTLVDFASFYKDNGITFTNFEELTEEIMTKPREILMNMPGPGSFITGYSSYAQHSTIREKYVGYDIGDVDAEIQFGTSPNEGVAAIGRFDPEATKNALSNQDEWPVEIKDRYQTEEYNNITIHSWGDGFKTNLKARLTPPHVDILGRAKPLAVTGEYLFYHPSLENVKLMIDASRQKGQSLADLPEYSSLVDALAGLKVNSAIIGNGPMANLCVSTIEDDFTRLTEEEKLTLLGTPLKKFLTFGSALGKDENGFYTAIVIYHANSDIARENVSLLKQRLESSSSLFFDGSWSNLFTETDIKAEGNVLLARLYSESMSFWQSCIYSPDSLLYHEE